MKTSGATSWGGAAKIAIAERGSRVTMTHANHSSEYNGRYAGESCGFVVETPDALADRIRTTLKYLSPEQVTLSTDCGMKPLARMVSKLKLGSLAEAAAIVRKEIGAG